MVRGWPIAYRLLLLAIGYWLWRFAPSPIRHAPSAVHGDDLSGHESAFLRKQPDHGGVEVLGLADASAVQGLLGPDEVEDLFVSLRALGHGGGHQAGGDHVEPDALDSVMGRGRPGEADDRRLRRRVGEYWNRQLQRRLIASLNGILAQNVTGNAGDMLLDISGGTGDAAKFNAKSVIQACATLADRKTVVLSNGERYQAQHILIATGAEPTRGSAISGHELAMDSNGFFDLEAANWHA